MIIDATGRRVYPVTTMLETVMERPAKSRSNQFVSSLHELREKRMAVANYLKNLKISAQSYDNITQDKFIGVYRVNQLYDKTISCLVNDSGDDLDQIRLNYGMYGLAEYADVSPQTFIKNIGKIEEVKFSKSSVFMEVYYKYLLNNNTGTIDNIYIRFGKIGLCFHEALLKMGFVEQDQNGYKVTDLGTRHLTRTMMNAYDPATSDDYMNNNQNFANSLNFFYNMSRRRRDINEFRKDQSARS